MTAVAAGAALAPVAAQADQLVYTDASHDVQTLTIDSSSDPQANPGFEVDPAMTNGDIKRVFIHFRKDHLVIRTTFVDLRRHAAALGYTGLLRTNAGVRRIFDVEAAPKQWVGHDMLMAPRKHVTCAIGHKLGYTDNFARVSIPLSCLGNPRWIQFKIAATTVRVNQTRAALSGDGAGVDGIDRMPWTRRVHVG
ncbi:MAG: hypothetical protein ACXVXD_09345 [Nocardioidaceae bacterium]